jgi:hypothetical protein
MNNKVPYLVAGGVVGGILGWLIADYLAYQMDEKRFTRLADAEVAEDLVGGMDKELYEFDENADPRKTDYGGIVVMEEKKTLEELARPYQEETAPYILSAEEWEDPPNQAFERKTVLYYEMDSVYCTDEEELVDDPENLFVPNAHLHFGEGSDDPDVVYVSNPGRSEIYEIFRMRASYQVDVLGEVPVESPKEKVTPKKPANQPGSQKERKKKEAEELGDVD